jgi:hypothetical protein
MGALKKGLNPRARELGVYICGGRGKQSRNTPRELQEIAGRTGLDGDALVRTSRLTARIDNNAVADGFQIYLHAFVLTADGDWAVVQQGMNEATRLARRYHWHSAAVTDFTADPHTAIVGTPVGAITNLVDGRARPAQDALIAIAARSRENHRAEVRRLEMPEDIMTCAPKAVTRGGSRRPGAAQERTCGTSLRFSCASNSGRARGSLRSRSSPTVVHGTPTRSTTPARFGLRAGGRRPSCPVPLDVYDTVRVSVLLRARSRCREARPNSGERTVRPATRADPDDRAAHERGVGHDGGGATSAPSLRRSRRTVFDDSRAPPPERPPGGQPDLSWWSRGTRPGS